MQDMILEVEDFIRENTEYSSLRSYLLDEGYYLSKKPSRIPILQDKGFKLLVETPKYDGHTFYIVFELVGKIWAFEFVYSSWQGPECTREWIEVEKREVVVDKYFELHSDRELIARD